MQARDFFLSSADSLPAGARQPEGPAFDEVDNEAIRVHGEGRPPSGRKGLAEGVPIDLERSATLPTSLTGPFDPGLHSISISRPSACPVPHLFDQQPQEEHGHSGWSFATPKRVPKW